MTQSRDTIGALEQVLGDISQRAIELLIVFEVTSAATYERKYRRPIWPGENSGVTIGVGYDLGHTELARVRSDWSGVVAAPMLEAMETAVGVKGLPAKALATDLKDDIDIPWTQAYQVYVDATLPYWVRIVRGALPNTDILNGDQRGALVSLTYNRGASYAKAGDRYREMRAIKAHMTARTPERIPAEIRSMKRLWPDVPGLQDRREREAKLFEAPLAAHDATPVA